MNYERSLQARVDYIGSMCPWWCPCITVVDLGNRYEIAVRPSVSAIRRDLDRILAGIAPEKRDRFLGLSANMFNGLTARQNVYYTYKLIRDEFGVSCGYLKMI